jgi:exodeoxyribonuclease V beta subunit
VPAGLRAKNNQRAQVYLYHEKNKARLSFTPYGSELSDIEDDWERERIYYVAYTRASSLLILPFYDVWDSKINSTKSKLYTFLYKSISSLFADEEKKYVEEISDSGKILEDLQKEVQKLLVENKKQKEKEKGSQSREEISEEAQIKATRELSEKVPGLSLHKHSYSSLSHRKNISDDMTQDGGRTDKEDANLQQVSLANFDACENPVTYTVIPDSEESCPPADEAPYNYPKGARLGIALHEVFEKADFKTEENDENLQRLIRSCFEKQTLSIAADDPDGWLSYTSTLLWNTLNAKLPEISGAAQTGNYFTLSQLADDDKISEAEFNMNADISEAASKLLKNYCNGFIDLVFKRSVNGKEVYSILDWKSDTFEADQYSDGALLKAHTDDRYSIQRVLYSYSLIKWLASFYSGENETEIFENHFGGIYYAYVRGCQANTCSGIYARTWKNWQELESAFKKIMEAEHESR